MMQLQPFAVRIHKSTNLSIETTTRSFNVIMINLVKTSLSGNLFFQNRPFREQVEIQNSRPWRSPKSTDNFVVVSLFTKFSFLALHI
jgi:hypothetical protein